MNFDPCPVHLRPYRAASWKVPPEGITGDLRPVAKSISGSGVMTNVNGATTQHTQDGRTFVGPAGRFNWTPQQYLISSDSDLLPNNNNWSMMAIIWHDNQAEIDAGSSGAAIMHSFGLLFSNTQMLRASVFMTAADEYPRLNTQYITNTSTYFNALPAGQWNEPLCVVVTQNVGAGNIIARYVGLYSRVLHVTHTFSGAMTDSNVNQLMFGRYLTGNATYNASRTIQDCWTVLQDYAATENDAFAFRDHIIAGRDQLMFDPCPVALYSTRVESFKCYDRMPGSWPGVLGKHSLVNNNTVQTRHPKDGRTIVGSSTLCDWTALEAWSTDNPVLLRNGQNWTKVAVVWHTAVNFNVQAQFSMFLFSADANGQLEYGPLTTDNLSTLFWYRNSNGVGGSNYRSDNFASPYLIVCKNDHGNETVYQTYRLDTGANVHNHKLTQTLGNRTVEYYGRAGLIVNPAYNGSHAIIDCIQVFDSVLSDADLQSICAHIWKKRELLETLIRGQSI